MTRPPTLSILAFYGRPLARLAGFLERVAREYGPVVRFKNIGSDVWLVSEPALVEAVLVSQATSFRRGRGHERLRALLGNGLLTAEEPAHLHNRRLVQPAFHRDRLQAYATVMVDATRRRTARWGDGTTIAIDAEARHVTLDIVARTLFGTDLQADATEIGDALDDVMTSFPARMSPFGALLDKVPVPSTRKFFRARQRLAAVVLRLISERRTPGSGRDDVLSMLLERRDEAGAPLSDEHVRDEVLTLLLAGHETTATAIAWSFYLLSRYPDVEARVAREVSGTLGLRVATFDDVANLPYLRAALTETLRLYPPAWTVGRRAAENVTIGGYTICRGDIVLVSPYVTQRDPAYYPAPECFEPARWLTGRQVPKFAYFPFGGGNRTCIGESFALTELALVVATIVQRARLSRSDAGAIEPRAFVTLRPASPILVHVNPRFPVVSPAVSAGIPAETSREA